MSGKKIRVNKNRENRNGESLDLKQCTLYVDGMHCDSCEVLIEKKLLKKDGIESADASLNKNRVEVVYQDGHKPDLEQLNKEFSDLGYQFSDKKFVHDETPLIKFAQDGRVDINPAKLKSFVGTLFVVSGLLIAFFFFDKLGLGKFVSVDANSTLPMFFVLGVVAGLSSCAALIGGLILSMSKQWHELYIDSESKVEKALPHMMFHLGRLISFFVFGGVLGLISKLISFDNPIIFSIFTILISAIMFILALQMLGVEWAKSLQFTAPKTWTRFVADEKNFQGKHMPFLLGALTFFIPCGFTLLAQTIALTSGSFLRGGLVMVLFALGTLLPLLGVTFSSLIFNSKPALSAKFNSVAGVIVIFFSIYNINGQLNVLGLPSLNDINLQTLIAVSESNAESAEVTQGDSQGQIINITAKGFSYTATGSTVIKAGVPTKLVVDNQGIQGCGASLSAQGLMKGFKQLSKGINEIDLGSPKKGTYKITCSMGMVPPVTITVQ